jgi:hypothetical protein
LTSEPSEYKLGKKVVEAIRKRSKKKVRDPEIEEKLKKRLKRRLQDRDTKQDRVLIRIEQSLTEVNESLREIIRLLNAKC